MAKYNKKNLATSTLAAGIASGATAVTVQTGDGASFPITPFYATLTPFGVISTLANSEIVQVTAVSTDTLTITRAQRGTTAKAFVTGDVIANGSYIQDIDDLTQDDIGDGTTYKQYSATDKTKLAGVATGADVTATQLPVATHAATSKTTPVDADETNIADSAASFALKKVTWANIKATLKTYFDTLYQPLDATLTALAGLATGASKIPYSTGTDTFGQLTLDTDGTLTANSDTTLASQKAAKTYVDTLAKNKQADTTNGTWTRPLIQSGMGRVVSGAGATYQQEFVTFPVAFKTGTIPTVVASSIGYRPAGSTYDPSAIVDLTWSRFSSAAVKPQATGFNAWLARFDGAGMSDDYYYSWIAIGETT